MSNLLLENGQSKEAFLCAKQLIDLGLKKEELYVIGGKALIKSGNPEEARKILQEGLDKYPNSEELLFNMGISFQATK